MTAANQRRFLRTGMYVLLIGSALASFFLGERLWVAVRDGSIPIWLPLLAPALYTLFVVVYSVDRFLAVRRHGNSAGRAFFQVGFALILLTLVWPGQADGLRLTQEHRAQEDYATRLLRDPKPHARAAACELIGLRAQIELSGAVRTTLENEDSPHVRRVCKEALQRLAARAP